MVFLICMTLWAMVQQVVFDWSGLGASERNLLLFGFGAAILGFTLWILIEAIALSTKMDNQ